MMLPYPLYGEYDYRRAEKTPGSIAGRGGCVLWQNKFYRHSGKKRNLTYPNWRCGSRQTYASLKRWWTTWYIWEN